MPFPHLFILLPSSPPPFLITTTLGPYLAGFTRAVHHKKYKEKGIVTLRIVTPPLSQISLQKTFSSTFRTLLVLWEKAGGGIKERPL